jgi:hypothetical protein
MHALHILAMIGGGVFAVLVLGLLLILAFFAAITRGGRNPFM